MREADKLSEKLKCFKNLTSRFDGSCKNETSTIGYKICQTFIFQVCDYDQSSLLGNIIQYDEMKTCEQMPLLSAVLWGLSFLEMALRKAIWAPLFENKTFLRKTEGKVVCGLHQREKLFQESSLIARN